MGLRGIGARAKPKIAKGKRYPWKRKGLKRAERVIAFLQWLPITKGPLAGRKMKLLPEQREFVERVYAEDSNVQTAVQSEPRGNGKTGLLSGLAMCHLLGPEAEMRGEIYSCAIDRQQAALLFAEMEAIIWAVPDFDAQTNVVRFHKRIEVLEGNGKGSTYEALSADARRAHGLAPTLWIYDEMAQARDREALDNLTTAMGKRARSLGIVISTQAPRDDHPLSELIDRGLDNPEGPLYVQLIAAPADADPFSEETIRACNPAVGKFLKLSDLMTQAEQARTMPSFEMKFRNLRLNQRVSQSSGLVTRQVWSAGDGEPREESFRRGPIRVGLDLSSRQDLTALAYSAELDGQIDVRCEFFAPALGMAERSHSDRAPYELWAQRGFITATPGASVDYDCVALRLAALAEEYSIEAVFFDRWRIDVLESALKRINVELPLVPHGQGFKDMAPAIDQLESALLNRRIRHGGNPVLRMCVTNAVVVSDAAGNRKFDKSRSKARIDGIVALAMTMARPTDEMDVAISGSVVVL